MEKRVEKGSGGFLLWKKPPQNPKKVKPSKTSYEPL